jgi:RsmE family RNA methyltransferase
VNSTSATVELLLSLDHDPLIRKPIDLIVGLSRPQTVKKVLQAAVMLGVRSLHFVSSERGEKSYRTSHALQADRLEEESIKALEQIWDSVAPSVHVHFSLRRVFDALVGATSQQVEAVKLVADPSGVSTLTLGSSYLVNRPTVLAVGPESGWSVAELAEFSSRGFEAIHLGERVLRVEIALVFLLGQLAVLQGSRA